MRWPSVLATILLAGCLGPAAAPTTSNVATSTASKAPPGVFLLLASVTGNATYVAGAKPTGEFVCTGPNRFLPDAVVVLANRTFLLPSDARMPNGTFAITWQRRDVTDPTGCDVQATPAFEPLNRSATVVIGLPAGESLNLTLRPGGEALVVDGAAHRAGSWAVYRSYSRNESQWNETPVRDGQTARWNVTIQYDVTIHFDLVGPGTDIERYSARAHSSLPDRWRGRYEGVWGPKWDH